jgi:AcrR family transcriptional regulator
MIDVYQLLLCAVPDMSQRPRADAARNTRRIVDAAHVVFSRGGLNVPMDEIAAEAGVGIATLYRRFPSKEELVKAVLDQRFVDVIAPAIARAEQETDLREAVILALEAGVSCASQEQITLAVAANVGAMTMDLAWRFFEPVSALIRRGQEAGVFRADLVPEDTPRIVLMLVGTLPSFEPGSDGWRRYLDLVMDALTSTGTTTVLPPPMPVRDHTPGSG